MRLPTPQQKAGLDCRTPLRLYYVEAALTDPPTDAELVAALGGPGDGDYVIGATAIIKNTVTGTVYLALSDGAGWHYLAYTLAV